MEIPAKGLSASAYADMRKPGEHTDKTGDNTNYQYIWPICSENGSSQIYRCVDYASHNGC
jgi:hypothetical protein